MNTYQLVSESLQVTPVIKKTVQEPREIEICPHCNEEIQEKTLFCITEDDNWYFYHRGDCATKGPIKVVTKEDAEEAAKIMWK